MSGPYLPIVGTILNTYDPRTGNGAWVKVTQVSPPTHPGELPTLMGTRIDGTGHYTLIWSYPKNTWIIYGDKPV